MFATVSCLPGSFLVRFPLQHLQDRREGWCQLFSPQWAFGLLLFSTIWMTNTQSETTAFSEASSLAQQIQNSNLLLYRKDPVLNKKTHLSWLFTIDYRRGLGWMLPLQKRLTSLYLILCKCRVCIDPHRESPVNRADVLQRVVIQINREERMLDTMETVGKIKAEACNYLEWNFSVLCSYHLA